MAQIQVRDEDGHPIPRINIRIIEGLKENPVLADAIFDYDTDMAGNKGWRIPHWPDADYTLHVNAPGLGETNETYDCVARQVVKGHDTNIIVKLKRVFPKARTGIVKADRFAVRDDEGLHHYLGITCFWAPIGFKSEREHILRNLDWCQKKKIDYIRFLCEVDWAGREILPSWPDYEAIIAETIDEVYKRGMRSQLTLVGGRNAPHMEVAAKVAHVVQQDRQHKVLYIEDVNEAARLDKVDRPMLQNMTNYLRSRVPNLIGLSHPMADWNEWKALMKSCGGNVWILHTERNDADFHWRQVRQAYDFASGEWVGSNQEGPGPASSVGILDDPRQLALYRFLSHMCRCGFFTFHVGAGVTGLVDPERGRPANFDEVPNIDVMIDALHSVEPWMPEGFQNWQVVNNGRDIHPLPLNGAVGKGFWERNSGGSVNKNYMALGPDGRFVGVLLGVNIGPEGEDTTHVGTALRKCQVSAYDPVVGLVDARTLASGEKWMLPGRADKMMGYVVVGRNV